MFSLRTLKFLAAIMVAYAALVVPGFIWPSYFDSAAGLLILVPGLSIYFFNKIGVPGLLEHDGYCGWGLCSPTLFGMVFVIAAWLLLAWLVAWAAAEMTRRRTAR